MSDQLADILARLDRMSQVTINKGRGGSWGCELWDGPDDDFFGEGDGATMQEAIEQSLIDLEESRS